MMKKIATLVVLSELVIIAYLLYKMFSMNIPITGGFYVPPSGEKIEINGCGCDLTRTEAEDKNLCFKLIPNKHVLCQRGNKTIDIRINSLGFRDLEFSERKDPNILRIFAMGDSYTYGWNVNLEDTWPKKLERILNSKNLGKKFEVWNLGIPGLDIWNVANYLVRYLNYSPDIVITSFQGNDVIPEKEVRSATGWDEEKIVRMISNRTHRIMYINKSFALIRNHFKGMVMIALWPTGYDGDVKMLAREYNFFICDLNEIYRQHSFEELSLEDGHPNELAYELVAEKISKCLLRYLYEKS